MEEVPVQLNPEQLEAVSSTEGYIRVIAGAGSGKTRALSHRFAFLVNEVGILPGNILCVTFTNKAANEMRQRIHKLTGDNDTGYICTFHSFCVSVLQEDIYAIQYPKNFMILDNSDIDDILKIIFEERNLSLRDMTYAHARDMIEMRKLVQEPHYYLDMITMDLNTLKEKYQQANSPEDIIFYGYLYYEKKCFALDYNDLIKFTLYIYSENADIRQKWQERLEYIMIDEFQDIDALQYELMSVLCAYHNNLFIVGDPDQTIYTWRGANVRYLLEFDKNFPNVRTIMMVRNYRSTPEILAVANSLIEKNKQRLKKDLLPNRESGDPVYYLHAEQSDSESSWLAKHMAQLHEQGIAYHDMAVLYRAHYLTRSIEEALLKNKIPYTIYNGTQFFDRTEIKDSLCYLRFLVYKDDLSFKRIINSPKRNIGKTRLAFLQEYAEQNGCTLYRSLLDNIDTPNFSKTRAQSFVELIERYEMLSRSQTVSELFATLINESGYETMLRTEGNQERLDNLAELKQTIHEYETSCGEECTLEMFLKHIAMYSNLDISNAEDKVKLMTIHTAKGLEFPYVFLCALNEGIIPSKKTHTIQAMEEERRLAFVAITRAKNGLYLSEANGWQKDGTPRYPSRFVLDISPELLTPVLPLDNSFFTEARSYIDIQERNIQATGTPASTLALGTRIKHAIFGDGMVIGIDEAKQAHIVMFDNMSTPRKLSFKVKLEKI